ncbi:vacuolar-type H+-ATPase subunit I/STV1 [Paenibacillus anaericanus]|uniref:DUF4190 domain-containing protein n=1 Tax=Paenibacillus anaericanus TaxID=170367 RepID=A0A3S1DT02_9BACL|nr:DUF4190 domain-containing protein [Paenibacillus anaericanus]MDQ0087318.1 vacuolar-type H+-ATPase subunit I/STV1 [Paenibacillus anaericanus]RUT46640.1 DUF4190 domain-containing protein [Paenibacillus anaericanus]
MNQNSTEQSYQYSTLNDYPPNYPPAPAKTNGKSIAALVLGILSVMIPYVGFLMGIIAIVFSSLSFKEIKRTNEQGKGLSIAGLVCGIVGTVLWGIIILIVVLAVLAFSSVDSYNYSNF